MATQRISVWDLPTRLFHWCLVALIAAAIATGKVGGNAIDWHGRIGLAILGLLVFRIAWGFLGSRYARFSSFLPTPRAVTAYLRGEWRGEGHNPLGALSVFGLLALIAVQLSTGLLGNDDIAFEGPLTRLVSKDFSDLMTGFHKQSIKILVALIVLHLLAVAFYALIKRKDIVKPMIVGWREVSEKATDEAGTPSSGSASRFLIALSIALLASYVGSGVWIN